jgi:hypothetical protein
MYIIYSYSYSVLYCGAATCFEQCCGSGSGIGSFFDPRIRDLVLSCPLDMDPGYFFQIPDFLRA